MKKTLALILSAVIILLFSACGRASSNTIETEPPNGTPTEAITPHTESPPVQVESAVSSSAQSHAAESDAELSPASVPTSLPAPSLPQTPVMIPSPTPESSASDGMTNISITIGGAVFSAKLYDNDAANALLDQFPLSLNMSELNGNEKYYYLPSSLPTASRRVGSINAGDLMLFGADCLVLFYESFTTSYSYTTLGTIEDASGLAAALGNGGVHVTFAASE